NLSPNNVLLVVALVALQFLGLSIAFGAELSAVGAEFSIAALMIYTSTVIFSLLFAITPGGIGIRETILLIVSGQMSLSIDSIILSSTIDRIVYFIILLLLTPVALFWKRSKQ